MILIRVPWIIGSISFGTVNIPLFPLLPDRAKIDHKFLFAIQFEHLINQLLIIDSDGTSPGTDGFTGQVQILADMPGIDENFLCAEISYFHSDR